MKEIAVQFRMTCSHHSGAKMLDFTFEPRATACGNLLHPTLQQLVPATRSMQPLVISYDGALHI